jgi:DNA-binding NtrC family response regulator
MAHFILLYNHPELGEQRFELASNRSYRIGSRSDNDLVLPQKDVSRHHAILRTFDGTFQVTDLNSKNGTFVNGKRTEAAEFRCGDQLNISSARMVILEVSSGAFSGVSVPGPGREQASEADSRDDTMKFRIEATAEDMVSLLETAAAAVARGALAEPLKWAVDNLGIDGVVVLYRDESNNVAMVTSAGDLGLLIRDSGMLNRLVLEQETFDGPSVREVREHGETLLVAPLRKGHTMVLRYSGDPPAVGDVRALMAAEEAVLGASTGEQEGPQRARPGAWGPDDAVLGGSRVAESCREMLAALARRHEPVLLTGEVGCGRRRLAEAMHRGSERAGQAFELVDCAALQTDFLETEIVGSAPDPARGTPSSEGAAVRAEGGTLCLHDVHELSPQLQSTVRQILKDGVVCRTGDAEPRRVDVRIMATTTEDLDGTARVGGFDADLLDRIAVLRMEVPALRARPEDIPVLANRFLLQAARELDKSVVGFAVQAMEALVAYDWPGNLAELEIEMRRVVGVVRAGGVVELGQLKPEIRECGTAPSPVPPGIEELADSTLDTAREAFERWMVQRALAECDGNQTRAAARLGLSRAGLFKKMKRLKI